MKKFFKTLGILILAIIIIVLIYFAYVLIDYHRIDDKQSLNIVTPKVTSQEDYSKVPLEKNLHITSYNIGFGAYTSDYSFFMDGGKYSRAFSKDSVITNMHSIINFLKSEKSDFYFIQEVDKDSTRAYHVNQLEMISKGFQSYFSTYAINYDSPYLFYPITSPHGKSLAGINTLSKYSISDSLRRSLPIQKDLAKLIDLDRCYSVNKIPTVNGKYLCLYNFHLSAYTTDETIANKQLQMLYKDITNEYENGNYVVCGGDFNKDLLGDSSKIFGVSGEDYSWAKAFPFDSVPEHFNLQAPFDKKNPVPSCRNANEPYDPSTDFMLTIDGFLVSDNVKVNGSTVIDTKFAYSDHNPVTMDFQLKE